jgi:hypothetical protein
MRFSSLLITLLVLGSSLGCRYNDEKLEVSSHSFYLAYEVDFKYFSENLPGITPIMFDCYFNVVNNTAKPVLLNFSSTTGNDYFFTADSLVLILLPFQDTILLQPSANRIIRTKFPYRKSKMINSKMKGSSMEEITRSASEIDFYFNSGLGSDEAGSVVVDKSKLFVYFLFTDTTITCTPQGCGPYIDPITILGGRGN